MHRLVWITLALVALTSAYSVQLGKGRIGGPPVLATDSFHAVLVMVTRSDIAQGFAAFGGGSIVSRNRVLTAAHVVRGATEVTVGFYNARFEANRFRRATADYILPLQGFNSSTFLNDLAILSFPENTFPATNVIAVAIAQATGNAFFASYGFTSPDANSPNQFPLMSSHTISSCTSVLNNTASHFCSGAVAPSVVCPGDNGSGLYTGTGSAARLVGIASLINEGCVVPVGETTTLVGFTNLSEDNIQRFLRSQNIVPRDAEPVVEEEEEPPVVDPPQVV